MCTRVPRVPIPGEPMIRHLGRFSLVLSVSSWLLLEFVLLYGGLDPPPGSVPMLEAGSMSSALLGGLGALAGIAAVVRRRQRISGALGSALGILFLLVFTGAALLPLAR